MNKIDIRGHIIENFKESNSKDIEESIESSIKEKDEVTLPGLGVFFELLWQNSNKDEKEKILESIKKGL